MVCAFTGHRPEHLPWGVDEDDPRCMALKTLLRRSLLAAYARGYTTFLCGMARGCDLYFAEAVLGLRKAGELRGAALVAMIPCPSQAGRWGGQEQTRYRKILAHCTEVRVLEAEYSAGCMLRRNRAMVDAADALMTVFDGSEGGTAATVRYAKRRGVTLLPLWL